MTGRQLISHVHICTSHNNVPSYLFLEEFEIWNFNKTPSPLKAIPQRNANYAFLYFFPAILSWKHFQTPHTY